YTIIALVVVSTMGLAYLLGKSEIRTRSAGTPSVRREGREAERWGDRESNPKSEIRGQSSEVRSQRSEVRGRWSVVSSPYVAAALCWLLFVEIGIAAWYRVHETNLVSGIRWSVQMAEQGANFPKLNYGPEIPRVLPFDEGQT